LDTKERILVTGGAGFIGSELVHQLSLSGAEVIAVDNLVNGRRENIASVLSDRVEFVQADIRDAGLMEQCMQGVDRVFHLACLGVRHSLHSPHENHAVNASGTLTLLSSARAAGVKRFVYVSSSEVYGTAQRVPIAEDHPTFPMTVYGASKLAGECYARAFYQSYAFPMVVVRPFNSYGPRCHHEGDSGEVIPKFLLRGLAGQPMVIFGDGRQTRDFTYVADTARGILSAGFAAHVLGETINLGSGKEISLNALAREITRTIARPDAAINYQAGRPGDVLRLCAATQKARRLLHFKPEVSFEHGLVRLMDWYADKACTAEKLLESEIVCNWKNQQVHVHV